MKNTIAIVLAGLIGFAAGDSVETKLTFLDNTAENHELRIEALEKTVSAYEDQIRTLAEGQIDYEVLAEQVDDILERLLGRIQMEFKGMRHELDTYAAMGKPTGSRSVVAAWSEPSNKAIYRVWSDGSIEVKSTVTTLALPGRWTDVKKTMQKDKSSKTAIGTTLFAFGS